MNRATALVLRLPAVVAAGVGAEVAAIVLVSRVAMAVVLRSDER
jgi:hypothetical protein